MGFLPVQQRRVETDLMSNDKITITWEVSDGYCGGSAPQYFDISPSEFNGNTPEEIREMLDSMIQEDFQDKVTWSCSDFEEYVSQIQEALKEDKE
jgi:predicted RNase H-like HicB family nuclease